MPRYCPTILSAILILVFMGFSGPSQELCADESEFPRDMDDGLHHKSRGEVVFIGGMDGILYVIRKPANTTSGLVTFASYDLKAKTRIALERKVIPRWQIPEAGILRPDEGRVVTVSKVGMVVVWDIETWSVDQSWWVRHLDDPVFDRTGRFLAFTRGDALVVRDAGSGRTLKTIPARIEGRVIPQCIDVRRDLLLARERDMGVLWYDMATGTLTGRHDVNVLNCQLAPAPGIVAVSSWEGTRLGRAGLNKFVSVFNMDRHKVLARLDVKELGPALAFSPGSGVVVFEILGGAHMGIGLWRWRDDDPALTLPWDSYSQVSELHCTKDGRQVIVGTRGGELLSWDLTRMANGRYFDPADMMVARELLRVKVVEELPVDMSEQPGGPFPHAMGGGLHAAGAQGRVIVAMPYVRGALLYDTQQKQVVRRFEHESPIRCSAVSSDGKRLATFQTNGTVTVWDTNSGGVEFESKPTGGDVPVRGTFVPGRSDLLFTYGGDGEAKLWKLPDGRLVRSFAHGSPAVAAAIHAKSKRIISLDRAGTTYCWSLGDGKLLWQGEDSRKNDLVSGTCAISSDARLAATSCDARSVLLWDMEGGTAKWRLFGEGGVSVSFLGEDRRLLVLGVPLRVGRCLLWNRSLAVVQEESYGLLQHMDYAVSSEGDNYLVAARVDPWYGEAPENAPVQNELHVRDSLTGDVVCTLPKQDKSFTAVEFLSDRAVVGLTKTGCLYLWEITARTSVSAGKIETE